MKRHPYVHANKLMLTFEPKMSPLGVEGLTSAAADPPNDHPAEAFPELAAKDPKMLPLPSFLAPRGVALAPEAELSPGVVGAAPNRDPALGPSLLAVRSGHLLNSFLLPLNNQGSL